MKQDWSEVLRDSALPHRADLFQLHMLMFFWTMVPSRRIIESHCIRDRAGLIRVWKFDGTQVEDIFIDYYFCVFGLLRRMVPGG